MRACVKAAVMPLSLKLPEGFMPSYCRNSRPGFESDVAGDGVGLLQDRLPLADGQHLFGRGERQQFAETPDAAEVERIGALGPFASKSRSDRGGCKRSQS